MRGKDQVDNYLLTLCVLVIRVKDGVALFHDAAMFLIWKCMR